MEEPQRTDLTYVTERIISLLCPAECPEHVYLQNLQEILLMLQSKHQHNYMLVNVSQRNEAFSRRTHQVLDTGWLDHLAPNLDQIFSVCSSMENWLQGHPRRVVVLHCRGGKGQLGVLVASYILCSSLLDSADLSLDRFAMKRFYSNKLSALMSPSQKRYVWLVSRVLKGELKTPPSPSFLLCVILHGLPRWRPDGECRLFLRVYQGLQAVCTSAVYHANAARTDRLCFELQPAQLLQDDVMVVCYDRSSPPGGRRLVFRLQFHMGLASAHTLTFPKAELDGASGDPTFPEDGKVELLLSDSPETIRGRQLWHHGGCVTVDYDTLDPVVRRDSYQDATLHTDGLHLLDLHHGGLLKRSCEEGAPLPLTPGGLGRGERTPSASSDSGLSVASQGQRGGGPPQDRNTQSGKLVAGSDFEIAPPLLEVMTELAALGRGDALAADSGLGVAVNGAAPPRQRDAHVPEDERGADAAPASTALSSSSFFQDLPGTQVGSWVHGRPAAPAAPTRGPSSREAVQKGAQKAPVTAPNTSSDPEEDLTSLTADVDESIEQLNQLILDLDPTFVPVPTRCSPPSRSASLRANGINHMGKTHQSGWRGQKQLSDVVDHGGGLNSPGWRSFPTDQGRFFNTDSEDHRGDAASSAIVPPTPAFPVSPPTPYVKHFPDSQLRTGRHNWTQDSRSFLDALARAGSTDGDVLRPEVTVTPASCQRIFGSVCSVSSESSLPPADSATPPPLWHERIPNPPSSPPLSVSAPIASSSPRGALRGPSGGPGLHGETDSADLSLLLLGNGGLEHSLLEAVEGLESLNLGGGHQGPPPLLPEKRRGSESRERPSRSPSLSGFSSPRSGSSLSLPFSSPRTPDSLRGVSGAPSPASDVGSRTDAAKFVQDTSKFWYKPDISRDQAIAVLKDREAGAFVVRDSHSFRGAYGLAMKVATPPPSALQQSKKGGDLSNELVRHFLIECTQKGVRLKGCPNEPYFGSLTALVCQHSITPLALPCKLILPDRDPVEDLTETSTPTAANSAAELLRQGAACNVWYLGSVALETLTGHQAVQKATTLTLAMEPPPQSTVVHFKVSAQGITLTDNQRKLFFRRHYAVNTVIFCSLDPQGRRWTRGSSSTAKIFGFVARKAQSETENMCHLFAEHDPEQPASAIVNFVSKVMIGSYKK